MTQNHRSCRPDTNQIADIIMPENTSIYPREVCAGHRNLTFAKTTISTSAVNACCTRDTRTAFQRIVKSYIRNIASGKSWPDSGDAMGASVSRGGEREGDMGIAA